jgi:branched-chain amino acid transport system ATP-binding protein
MSELLRLDSVNRRYGDLVAVDTVSLSLAPGERRVLIGPNGAGKSTLLDLVTGAARPDSGQIVFAGQDITRFGPVRRARLGIGRTHQRPAIWPGLTTLDSVTVGGWRTSSPASPHSELVRASLRLLDRVGLGDAVGTRAGELSHGQRRLLELAVALAGAPRLLVLDEPAAGLWPAEVDRLGTLLAGLSADIALLVVEHHLEFAYALADTVTVLHDGRHVATGTPRNIRRDRSVARAYAGLP